METKQATAEQQFIIDRIYVKDISFESPNSPAIFVRKWDSKIDLNLTTNTNILGENQYEVELKITIEAKDKDNNTSFLVEVIQAGIFMIKGYPKEPLDHLLGSFCPNTLFPYAREVIASLVSKGTFPELHLSPINFDSLYAQRKKTDANTNNS